MTYRADIDGLRAIAVLAVLFFHASLPGFSGGFVGVDVFFVISGYLIGGMLIAEMKAGIYSVPRFYARRAKRILPSLFLVLAVSGFAAYLILTPHELQDFSDSAVAAALGFSNIHFFSKAGYFAPSADQNPLLMTWSLGVEEQFYLLFPVVLAILLKAPRRTAWWIGAGIVLVSAAASALLTPSNPTFSFFLLPTRAWELGAGALLVAIERDGFALPRRMHEVAALSGLALIAGSVALLDRYTAFPGLYAFAPVLGTVLLLSSRSAVFNSRLLASRPTVFVGKISYSLYLWHWPLLSFASISIDGELPLGSAVGLLILSFVLAAASWYAIEQPFRRQRLSARPLLPLAAYGAAIGLAVFSAHWLHKHHGHETRFSPEVVRLEKAGKRAPTPCLASWRETTPKSKAGCMAPQNEPSVLLIGDSHAAALASTLADMAHADGLGFSQAVKSSCPAVLGTASWRPDIPAFSAGCSAFNRSALDLALQPNIRTVVLASYWQAPIVRADDGFRYAGRSGSRGIPALEEGLATLIRKLREAGKEVIVLGDTPVFRFHPVRQEMARLIPVREWIADMVHPASATTFSAPEAALLNHFADVRESVRKTALDGGARYVDLLPRFCIDDECKYGDGSAFFYFDVQHLTPVGAHLALTGISLAAPAYQAQAR